MPESTLVKRYELTRKARNRGVFFDVVRGSIFIAIIWFAIRSYLNQDPPNYDQVFITVLMLVLLSPLIALSLVIKFRVRREHLAVVVGDGWIEFPGGRQIESSEIRHIRVVGGLLHNKVVISLFKWRIGEGKAVVVYPHQYSNGSELLSDLKHLIDRTDGSK